MHPSPPIITMLLSRRVSLLSCLIQNIPQPALVCFVFNDLASSWAGSLGSLSGVGLSRSAPLTQRMLCPALGRRHSGSAPLTQRMLCPALGRRHSVCPSRHWCCLIRSLGERGVDHISLWGSAVLSG